MFPGGEGQKIAIARALYKNAPFIIMDEPTAALDPIAEAEIYERFNELVGGRTAIYIVTAYPPANSVMRFWCSMRAELSNRAPTRCW